MYHITLTLFLTGSFKAFLGGDGGGGGGGGLGVVSGKTTPCI